MTPPIFLWRLLSTGFLSMIRSLCLMTFLLFSPLAVAHHAAQYGGPNVGRMASFVQVQSNWAEYELPSEQGSWQALVLEINYAILDRFGLTLRAPYATVSPDALENSRGLADMEVGIRWEGLRTEKLNGVLGLSLELPTGKTEDGLGSGHMELMPYGEMSVRLSPSLYGHSMVRYQHSFDGHDHHHGGERTSVLSPHGNREMAANLGLRAISGPGYVGLSLETILGLDGSIETGPVIARTSMGTGIGEQLQIYAGMDVTLAGTPRYIWHGSAGFIFYFSSRTEKEPAGCGCSKPH